MIYIPAEDSFLLEEQVKLYAKGKSVLDIGSGSGIQALAALSAGAKSVLASDIDKESINHIKQINSKIKAIKSNLFSNVKGRFDLIVFNPPYLPEDEREDEQSKRATTGGKKGDEIILRFLKQSAHHLNRDGKILIVISSLTPSKRIVMLLKTLNLSHKILSSKKLFFEKLEVWEIKQSL
jgi:release factor glutamine methyltransferase